jgi:hypothetical protein
LRYYVFIWLVQRLKEAWWCTVGHQFQVSQEQDPAWRSFQTKWRQQVFRENDCVWQRDDV